MRACVFMNETRHESGLGLGTWDLVGGLMIRVGFGRVGYISYISKWEFGSGHAGKQIRNMYTFLLSCALLSLYCLFVSHIYISYLVNFHFCR